MEGRRLKMTTSIFPNSNQEGREMGSGQEERPFLEEGRLVYQDESDGLYTGDGTVDLHGKPVLKKDSGNWKACPFIIGTEFCERLAYYGIAINLVTYLTSKLHESNVSAARTVSTWSGTCFLTPLIGAVLADAYWGRYWIIAAFSTIYFIGMCTLTLSASVPAFKPAECVDFVCPSTTPTQYWVFFVGLYLIALGSGGIKPCVSSFGADQFDDTDPKERVRKGSFFNWFYFSISFGSLLSITLLVYIQDNVGWGLGFGIPAVFMGFALGSFVLGTPLYRFQRPGGSPITRMCQVFVAAFCKWNLELRSDDTLIYETRDKISAIERIRKLDHTDELTFLDKASVLSEAEVKSRDLSNPWRLCTVTQVEELKILIRMFPIWATGIIYSAAYAQESTMFVEQGMLMDTRIGSFTIPPASLSTFDVIGVICWVPIYDRLIVPKVRKLTGTERGFTELQKMGIGLFLSFLSMTAAALVETKRLQADIPISIFWQIPQYMLVGVSDAFMFIGTVEFFYDQSPEAMRSLCSALSLLTSSVGSYLSSFMLTAVTCITTRNGKAGWLPVNLNEGHLDYYFWLWGGLSFMNLIFYFVSAQKFKKKAS